LFLDAAGGCLSTSRAQIWKAWLPALIWLAVIAVESTGLASAGNTSWILYPIFHFLTGVDRERFFFWNHHIRKIGHFVGYGLLSYLLFRAWRATLPRASGLRWALPWAQIAFLMTALVASLDEWHQTYLPSRTGRWQDAVLDSSAALTVQVLLWIVLRGRAGPASRGSAREHGAMPSATRLK
jgi:VanZ family protein